MTSLRCQKGANSRDRYGMTQRVPSVPATTLPFSCTKVNRSRTRFQTLKRPNSMEGHQKIQLQARIHPLRSPRFAVRPHGGKPGTVPREHFQWSDRGGISNGARQRKPKGPIDGFSDARLDFSNEYHC